MKKNLRHNSLSTSFLFITGFCLYIFICLNIAASQSQPPLYYDFVAEKKDAVVKTLYQIQHLKDYPEILRMQRAIYGPSIDANIFEENQIRQENIQNLEAVLQTNPEERDVLYALSVLYKESAQMDKSRFYLEKAQAVDPSLK